MNSLEVRVYSYSPGDDVDLADSAVLVAATGIGDSDDAAAPLSRFSSLNENIIRCIIGFIDRHDSVGHFTGGV